MVTGFTNQPSTIRYDLTCVTQQHVIYIQNQLGISDHDGLGAGFGSFTLRLQSQALFSLWMQVWCWCGEEAEMAGAAKLSSDISGILL